MGGEKTTFETASCQQLNNVVNELIIHYSLSKKNSFMLSFLKKKCDSDYDISFSYHWAKAQLIKGFVPRNAVEGIYISFHDFTSPNQNP